jgi:hypothetical protein
MVALGSIADSLAQFSRTAALERLADVAETGFDIQRRIGSNFLITVVRSGLIQWFRPVETAAKTRHLAAAFQS